MKLKNAKIPETNRLRFSITSMDDVDTVFAMRSSPIVRKYIAQPLATNKEEAIAHIHKLDNYLEEDKSIDWIIVNKTTEEKVGAICLWNFSEDRKTAEVGYGLLPEYFKQGIMSEALQAIINFGVDILNLKTIEAFTQVDNISSKTLLVRNKFILDEDRRDPGFPKNRIYTLSL